MKMRFVAKLSVSWVVICLVVVALIAVSCSGGDTATPAPNPAPPADMMPPPDDTAKPPNEPATEPTEPPTEPTKDDNDNIDNPLTDGGGDDNMPVVPPDKEDDTDTPAPTEPTDTENPPAPMATIVMLTDPAWTRVADGAGRIVVTETRSAIKPNEVDAEARAIPADGYIFHHWDGAIRNSSNPLGVSYSEADGGEPQQLTAHFVAIDDVRIPNTSIFQYPHATTNPAELEFYQVAYRRATAIATYNQPLADFIEAADEYTAIVYDGRLLDDPNIGLDAMGSNLAIGNRVFLRVPQGGIPSTTDTEAVNNFAEIIVHEAAHAYDDVRLTPAQNTRRNELYEGLRQAQIREHDCDPLGNPLIGSACGPYQLRTSLEFFAVLSTAYSGLKDGDIGCNDNNDTCPAMTREEVRTRYPAVFAFLEEVYG